MSESSMLPHPLPEELVQLLSGRIGLLADPTRIRILDRLRTGERNVQTIADLLTTTQQDVSGHLRLLRTAGLVSRRPGGREVFYAVADPTVYEVWERVVADVRQHLVKQQAVLDRLGNGERNV